MCEISIILDGDETWPLINVLNEVCHGFYIDKFQEKIGSGKESVVQLLDKVSDKETESNPVFKLNIKEIKIIFNSFEEVFKAIDEWEFQTRIGVNTAEARKIQEKFIQTTPV
jgi:hypothetical protein